MAAAAPPSQVAPQLTAPLVSFREIYLDSTNDEDRGNPAPLMATFYPAHVVAQPAALYEALLGEDDTSTKAFLCLEQDDANPGTQGVISAVYGIRQYRQALGQPPNQWSDRVFGFTGDVLNRNAPSSVELGTTMFHLVANGAGLRIYTPETMNLILASDPTIKAVDIPIATTPGWETVRCCRLYPVPFSFVAPFLTRSLTPREAFVSIYQTAISLGQVDAIRSLLQWLSACLTRNDNLGPGTNHSHLGTAVLLPPRMDSILQDHRWRVVVRRLPGLSLAPTTVGASQITGVIGEVVQQIRGICSDADTRAQVATAKAPLDYYGPLLEKVLRLAQVQSQEYLQPVHQALAENKKQARKVWQKFVDAAAAELGYQGLNIIISGGVSNKLADADVGTALFRDLSAGINLYQLGANTNANADAMRGNASAYDLAMSGATGDFHALFNVINSKSIELPMNFYMTESQLKMMHVLMYTMWGPNHTAVRECIMFMEKAHRHHEVLIRYRPRVLITRT
jgi:hypothetical protein